MSEELNGEEYRGPSGVARDSNWLTSADLKTDRDTMVTISSVMLYSNVTYQGGREVSKVLALRFEGAKRELGLNATNRKTLTSLFNSSECGAWFGKRILLFVEDDVRRPDGTRGPAVRIRAKRVEQPTPAEPMHDPVDDDGGEE